MVNEQKEQKEDQYRIDCKLCGKTHIPVLRIGGSGPIIVVSIAGKTMKVMKDKESDSFEIKEDSKTVTIPYICPETGKKAQVILPYSKNLEKAKIVGWK